MRLEDLPPHVVVCGLLLDQGVTVVSVQWFGSDAMELTYKTPAGQVANELLYRSDESRLARMEESRPWSFDGDGSLFRLVSEAHRIRLAHLFDPVLAVQTSNVDPLPHQITAVYESMLPRQPLRFLLADDPGAGKTIMAGLLISSACSLSLLTGLPSGHPLDRDARDRVLPVAISFEVAHPDDAITDDDNSLAVAGRAARTGSTAFRVVRSRNRGARLVIHLGAGVVRVRVDRTDSRHDRELDPGADERIVRRNQHRREADIPVEFAASHIQLGRRARPRQPGTGLDRHHRRHAPEQRRQWHDVAVLGECLQLGRGGRADAEDHDVGRMRGHQERRKRLCGCQVRDLDPPRARPLLLRSSDGIGQRVSDERDDERKPKSRSDSSHNAFLLRVGFLRAT